ncbi:hypothetical protein F2P81_002861 [Scophthalmus maximus]|uniref:Uncharacterized protein n=1 Tax=Scophthalmus maximus TaxID=52904 RepID=A0A6A4TWB8_SCOMX|nr:hypothetical protein F2P81_002861 [Scophthalmus maximus]
MEMLSFRQKAPVSQGTGCCVVTQVEDLNHYKSYGHFMKLTPPPSKHQTTGSLTNEPVKSGVRDPDTVSSLGCSDPASPGGGARSWCVRMFVRT